MIKRILFIGLIVIIVLGVQIWLFFFKEQKDATDFFWKLFTLIIGANSVISFWVGLKSKSSDKQTPEAKQQPIEKPDLKPLQEYAHQLVGDFNIMIRSQKLPDMEEHLKNAVKELKIIKRYDTFNEIEEKYQHIYVKYIYEDICDINSTFSHTVKSHIRERIRYNYPIFEHEFNKCKTANQTYNKFHKFNILPLK